MLDQEKLTQTQNEPSSTQARGTNKARFVDIAGVVNFRDLGGYRAAEGRTVKWGRLYRSGQLDRVDTSGLGAAQSLGVRTIIDLRFEEETKQYQTNRAAFPQASIMEWKDHASNDCENTQSIKLSWRDAIATGDPAQVREAMRLNYPQKLYSHAGIYQAMLEQIVEQETPLLFHCAAGKDRTGIAAALILALLGVEEADIAQDYLLTQQEMPKLLESFRAAGATSENYADFQKQLAEADPELIKPIFDADPKYLQTLFSHVNEHFGNFAVYADQVLSFDQHQVSRLRECLLDNS